MQPSLSTASQSPGTGTSTSAARRVNRSCLECTRRKVKCDGRQPCSSCLYYRTDCGFRQRQRRQAVSRSEFDKASEQLDTQARVLETLFPGVGLPDLSRKTRSELLELLPLADVGSLRRADPEPEPEPDHEADIDDAGDDSASESGQPPAERHWDESLDQPATAASDDINAIGLAADHQARSYLGMTSMSAVFRAIFRLCPAAKEHAARNGRDWAQTEPQPHFTTIARDPAIGLMKEQRSIDFFFENLHLITPFLDEQDFRKQYAAGRDDASWNGLLNMVFALGSIASGSDSLHEHYYREARTFIGLDTLGSGNLESLQALCLLGGYYLHYRYSPNTAFGILGAAHRVAIALGLHREPRRRTTITDEDEQRRADTRRRTWWSLFCLDTWSSMPQGRPTGGRWDSKTMDTSTELLHTPDGYAGLSLQASVHFCLICDRIQHRASHFSRLSTREIIEFDTELETWYNSLPPAMMDATNSPPRFNVAREFMRNRYFGVRLILCRCSMLYLLYEWKKGKELVLDPKQQQMLDKGCAIATQAIDCIALHWAPNRIHIWNSGWYLFQACMVPLLKMAIERTIFKTAPREGHPSLDKAMETFAEMRPWMRAADRAPDIIAALYEALTAESDTLIPTPSASDNLDIFDMFGTDESLDWSFFLGDRGFGTGVFPP